MNHLTHPDSDWGSLTHDRDDVIRHLSAHPEHAWRYPAGYDFGTPDGEGTTGLDWAAAHRHHHHASPVSDTAYHDITGRRLDFTQPGPWQLTGYDHGLGRDVTTTHEGQLDGTAVALISAAYPGVRVWRACPARIDETYRDAPAAARRLSALLGVDHHTALAVLTIASCEQLGMRYAHGRFTVNGDDDQSWRILTIEPDWQLAIR